ncbi:hypothetical protein ACFV3S_23145 [Streptomyces sp. NPDC059749]|uniref:hypothetical protein n=1 Tax=Streptomyces sp. NPDC059749 TaxID=3346931 RepID=UPI00364D392A
MDDRGVWVDAPCLHKPLMHGLGNVSSGAVGAAGEVTGVEAVGLGGAVGTFLGVVGALDDVAADAW